MEQVLCRPELITMRRLKLATPKPWMQHTWQSCLMDTGLCGCTLVVAAETIYQRIDAFGQRYVLNKKSNTFIAVTVAWRIWVDDITGHVRKLVLLLPQVLRKLFSIVVHHHMSFLCSILTIES